MDTSALSFDTTPLRICRTGTNRPLSDQERRIVRHFIERAQERLAYFLNPSASLGAALDAQARSQVARGLQEYISHHQALISPLRRSPPEVLSEIFLHLAPRFSLKSDADSGYLPMFLGGICSYWRKVALSTPRLWSMIDINIKEGTEQSKCELIKLLTARSGVCLLYVKYHHPDHGEWTQDAQCCLEAILRSSSRWHSVSLSLPSIAYGLLSAIKYNLPELRLLTVEPTTWDNGAALPLCDAFAAAPQLSEITIGSTDMIFTAPWAVLEMYTVGWVDDGRYMQWLGQCTRLVEVDIYFRHGTFPDVTVTAHLPCLQILSLTGTPLGFLNSLTTPVLDRIEFLGFTNMETRVYPSDLASLVGRSKCQISELVFKGISSISDADIITCIALLPALHTLIIHTDDEQPSPLTDSFMGKLILPEDVDSPDGAVPIALQLSIVEFAGELAEDCEEDALLLLVLSRPLIYSLDLEDMELDEDTIHTLEQYHAEGGLRYCIL